MTNHSLLEFPDKLGKLKISVSQLCVALNTATLRIPREVTVNPVGQYQEEPEIYSDIVRTLVSDIMGAHEAVGLYQVHPDLERVFKPFSGNLYEKMQNSFDSLKADVNWVAIQYLRHDPASPHVGIRSFRQSARALECTVLGLENNHKGLVQRACSLNYIHTSTKRAVEQDRLIPLKD